MSKRLVLALAVAGSALVSSAAAAQDTIRVGWTIPAEEAKYWIMRRPEQFPNLGKTYKIEFTQFQGTAPMVQAMVAGALDCSTQAPLSLANGALQANLQAYIISQHVGERPGSFSVYWAVKEDSDIKTVADMKGRSVGTNVFGSGILGPMFLLLKKHGLDPQKDIKLVETGFPGSEDAIRTGRVDVGVLNQPFAARAEAKGGLRKLFSLSDQQQNIVHILEVCRKEFVDKNPELVKSYVRDLTAGMKKALANRDETLKVVNEVIKAPIPVLETYLLEAQRLRARAGRGAELRGHPGHVRHLRRHRHDRPQARRRPVPPPEHRRADRMTSPSPRASLTFPLAPSARGEGRGEGRQQTPALRPAAAPLPASGERGRQ